MCVQRSGVPFLAPPQRTQRGSRAQRMSVMQPGCWREGAAAGRRRAARTRRRRLRARAAGRPHRRAMRMGDRARSRGARGDGSMVAWGCGWLVGRQWAARSYVGGLNCPSSFSLRLPPAALLPRAAVASESPGGQLRVQAVSASKPQTPVERHRHDE